jgi:hypothetical protein
MTQSPAVVRSERRYFAYQLGYLSKRNIIKEVRKAEPRLNRLLSHAILFDTVRDFLSESIGEGDFLTVDEDVKIGEMDSIAVKLTDHDDEAFIEYVEDAQHESFEQIGKPRLIVVNSSCDDPLNDDEDDFENISNSSTAALDNDDSSDDDWSESTLEDDHTLLDEFCDVYPVKDPDLACLPHTTYDDDFDLWAQQPRVLSTSLEQDLLLEACS